MRQITWGSAILGSVVLMWSLSGCSPPDEGWQGKSEIRNGVTWVHNPKDPLHQNPVLELEEDLSIRGSETEQEQMFRSIRSLDVDADGSIYVLDEGASDIKVFSASGEYTRTIGRQGQGPDEFAFPIMVLVTPQSELLVHDMNQRALKVLDREGRHLRQYSIADKFQFAGPRFLAGGRMVGSYLVPDQQPLAELKLFDAELEPLLTLATLPVEPPPILHYFAGNSMSGLRWNVNGRDEIVWGNFLEPEYVLYIHDAKGDLVRAIGRDYDAVRITEADREPLLRKMFGDNPLPPQWDIRIPDRYPPFSGISCDGDGRIYVKTYTRAEGEQEVSEPYDVYDKGGRYLARVTLPVPLMVLKNEFLYTIVENAEGFQEVKRFKILWLKEI